MPILGRMIERTNDKFSHSNISGVNRSALTTAGTPMRTWADSLGIALTDAEKDFLDLWPTSLQEVIRVALATATDPSDRIPVTVSWAPAYDFAVHVWEAHATEGTDKQITIHLRSQYPPEEEE